MKPKKLKKGSGAPKLTETQLSKLHAKIEALKPVGMSHSAWSDALAEMAYNAANRAIGAGMRRLRKAIK